MTLEAALGYKKKKSQKHTYMSVAAASLSPDVPALSSPSLSPCGPCGRKNRLHNRLKCQKLHEDGHSSAGSLQLVRESPLLC